MATLFGTVLTLFLIFYIKEISGNDINPRLVHLSLGTSLSSRIVMWSTKTAASCSIHYYNSNESIVTTEANTTKLLIDSWNAMSHLHRAVMEGLENNKTYHYHIQCNNEENSSSSEIFNFDTFSFNKESSVRVLVYGDMGSVSGRKTVPALLKELSKDTYHAVLHVGDFGYDLDSNGGLTGDEFLELVQPIASKYPYMTSPGNHELGSDLHHYRYRFSMPGSEWPMPLDQLWYSFDMGPVHFISFSTEVYFIHNQNYACTQYDWLLNDLMKANQNRDKTPWIIAMGHRPMYCSNTNWDDCTPHFWGQWVKRGLEDLFYGMGVDLIIEAHEHSYERLWPVFSSYVVQHNYINPRAPVHVISGAGGNGEGVDWMGKTNEWSAFRADKRSKNSYGRLSIVNKTHLHFDQVSAVTQEVIDEFWVIQENHGPLIDNINCDDNSPKSKICSCPPPFRYVTWAIICGIVLFMLIVTSIMICCCSCRCCGCCCLRACVTKTRSRRQFRHQPLVNVETASIDTDDESANYWLSYSIELTSSDLALS